MVSLSGSELVQVFFKLFVYKCIVIAELIIRGMDHIDRLNTVFKSIAKFDNLLIQFCSPFSDDDSKTTSSAYIKQFKSYLFRDTGSHDLLK